MLNRTTAFVVGALTCLIAGGSIVTMHLGDAGAADECLAAPKTGAPSGQHWYYRIDRATQRHCWYLGDKHETISRTAKPAPVRRTAAAADRTEPETALAPSIANVHAEWPAPQTSGNSDNGAKIAPSAPPSAAAPEGEGIAQAPSSNAASEAPQPRVAANPFDEAISQFSAGGTASAAEPTKPSSAPLPMAAADPAPAAKSDTDATPVITVAPVAPTIAVALPTPGTKLQAAEMGRATSLSALFLAAFGALVFVTLAMGLSYFFTERRRIVRLEREAPLAHEPDWPQEPFRIPSSLRQLAQDSFASEAMRGVSEVDPSRRQAAEARDPDVHQIEQLLGRVVRRSEGLRRQIRDLTNPA